MRTWALGILAAFVAGLGLGLWFNRIPAAAQGKEIPAVRLATGALVLHQNPQEPAPKVKGLPAGYKVRTVARFQIEPTGAIPVQSGAIPVQSVTVAQVDTPQGPRVVVEDAAGRVVDGAAWDVGPPVPEYHWSLSAVRIQEWNGRGSWGAQVANYHGRLVSSVAVTRYSIQAGIGVRW